MIVGKIVRSSGRKWCLLYCLLTTSNVRLETTVEAPTFSCGSMSDNDVLQILLPPFLELCDLQSLSCVSRTWCRCLKAPLEAIRRHLPLRQQGPLPQQQFIWCYRYRDMKLRNYFPSLPLVGFDGFMVNWRILIALRAR